MRKKIAAGNWKMNTQISEGLELASEVVHMAQDEVPEEINVILIPPFTHITSVRKMMRGHKNIFIGAQNCHEKGSGAYTGEISADILESCGVQFVVLGHSERREYFQESHETLAEKTKMVLKHKMGPIFCCGETLDVREANKHFDLVKSQIQESLFDLEEEEFDKIIIAYEPVWAIGTGVTASSDQAQEMHAFIRGLIAERYSSAAADQTSILYGGSVKPGNAKELFACPDVDGGLIGGASLKSRDFVDIAKSF